MSSMQAILPVAGLGTRFLPWTKIVPKELLPLGNQPIIALLVDECLSVGIDDICFVISKGKESLIEYFQEDPALNKILAAKGKLDMLDQLKKYDNVRFHVVYQDEQLGDGHAIYQAHEWATSDMVAVLFGDDLIVGEHNGLQQLTAAFKKLPDEEQRESIMLCLEDVPRAVTNQYGIASIDEARSNGNVKRVTGLVEKPAPADAPSTLGVVGKYLIPRSTIATLPDVTASNGGEIRLIDAFLKQLSDIPIYGCVVEGTRVDTGRPEGYKKAVELLG